MLRTTGRFLLLGALVAGTAVLAAARPAPAAELKKDTSLAFAPADAAFYFSMLRNKEQVDLFYKSNAYKTLRDLPLVKEAWKMAQGQLSKEGGPLEMYRTFTKDKQNQEVIDILLEGLGDEVFVAGGKTWVDLSSAYSKLQIAQYVGMLKALTTQGDPNKGQFRGMLLSLKKDREKLKVPELLIGLKLKDTKRADKQVTRLYKMADALISNNEQLKEKLGGKLKQEKVADGTFVTLQLNGGMLPWGEVDLSDFEENKGDFDDLINHAKKMTLTVSIGVAKGYLVIGVTPTTKELEGMLSGKGKLLADRDELKPVLKNEEKKLVGIGYGSAALASSASSTRGELDNLAKEIKAALEKVEQIKEERRKAIAKDLDALVADLKSLYPADRAGAISFSYLTERGYEGFAYDYNDHSYLKGTKCQLHNHFGGNPIFAAAFATPVKGTTYLTLVKWVKKVHGHGEGIFNDLADEDAKTAYKKFTDEVFPLLKKLDETTTKQLIPSMKNGGMGLVIDGKWKSKQWVVLGPKFPNEMPMLEIGLLLGISDAKLFTSAMTEYRKTLNDLYAKARESAPNKDNIPEFKIPVPDADKSGPAVLYSWALPDEAGLDKQFVPTAGVGKSVAVLALSKKHAERLVSSMPLKVKDGPLATKKDLVGVSVLNFPGLVDVAMPWVEFALQMRLAQSDDDAGKKAKEQLAAHFKQVKIVGEVLKAYKGSTSASYLEGKSLVTHTEIVVKDLEKVLKP